MNCCGSAGIISRLLLLLICTEKRVRVIDAFIALAGAIIIVRRLLNEAWTRYRWDGRPTRQP